MACSCKQPILNLSTRKRVPLKMKKRPSIRRQIVTGIALQAALLLTVVLLMTVYFASWATHKEVSANRQVAVEALSTFAKSQLYYFDHDALRGSIVSAVNSSMFEAIELSDRYGVVLISEPKQQADTGQRREADHVSHIYHGENTLLGELRFWYAPVRFNLDSITGVWYLNICFIYVIFIFGVVRARQRIEAIVIAPINKFLTFLKHRPDRIVAAEFESEEFSVLAKGFHELHLALENEAARDSLTGLLNRRQLDLSLVRELKMAESNGYSLSLLFMDADKFKLINDTFGHSVGDEFLKRVSKRLRTLEDENVLVFRFGGDEFVLLLRDHDKEKAVARAEQIHRLFERPVSILNTHHETTFSIGVVSFPEDGVEAGLLLARADMAVYNAKRSGRRRTIPYNQEFEKAYQREAMYERSLRKALTSRSIFFHRQPVLRVHDMETWGREALIRIPSLEDGKFVPPDLAINLASQSGYLSDLTDLTLDLALNHQSTKWSGECLCINFSAEQLIDASTLAKFEGLARHLRRDVRKIVIEVTEDKLIEKPELIELLHQVARLGFRVSLDDFGTAYSALACVRLLPLEFIKIDKSLLWAAMGDRRDRLLFEAAVGIARTFDCKVVVEGIETPEQLDYVSQLGVEFVQGFYVDALAADKKVGSSVA